MNKKTNSLIKKISALAAGLLFFCQATLVLAERTTTYLHTDGLGSVVAASDENGNVLWRKSYAPYGTQIDEQEDDQKLSYTGKPHDDDLGLTYFGARWYDPQAGRFTGIDPVGFVESSPQSFNRYAYANNNPYKYVDPDGRLSITVNEVTTGTPGGAMSRVYKINLDLTTSKIESYINDLSKLSKHKRRAEKIGDYVLGERAGPLEGSKRDDIVKFDKLFSEHLESNNQGESGRNTDWNWSVTDFEKATQDFYDTLPRESKSTFKEMYGSPWEMREDGGLIDRAIKNHEKSLKSK